MPSTLRRTASSRSPSSSGSPDCPTGLNEGGGLIIAEKVLARSAKFQDMMTFPYYGHKLRSFSEKSLLDKERSLRGQMVPWDEATMVGALHEAGFQSDDIQRFWQNHLFVAWIVRKSTPRSRLHQSILPMSVGRGLTLPGIVPGLDDIGPEPRRLSTPPAVELQSVPDE